MVSDPMLGFSNIVLAGLVAYFLGALPLADHVSRRNGVDIFSVGTGLAGASNVRRCVGNVPALLVCFGDFGKGALAIIISQFFGFDGAWLLVAAVAVVLGHWKSVFTKFRGGDGQLALGGAIVAMFPTEGMVSGAVAVIIALGGQKLPYSSLLSIVFGYGTLVTLVMINGGDTAQAFGVGILSGVVLSRALLGHRRRNSLSGSSEWENLESKEATGGPGTLS